MSTKTRVPSYRRHKQSGQAVVTLTDALTGKRKDHLLGKYNSAASRAEYKRLVLDWEARGRRLPDGKAAADLTVVELADRYWLYVESYYRHADSTPTGEVQAMRYALRPLRHLHEQVPVMDFGPAHLKSTRELMVRGYEHPKYGPQGALCRNQVNARIKRIRRMFKWGVAEGLVPAPVLWALQALAPLKQGRSEARESKPVLPVARVVVEDTLPLLRPMQADMVMLQLESGMRPGELVVMRPCDMDMTGPVWLFRPSSHKTQHHGHERIVTIGPKGQAIIRRYLTTDTQAYLFSPRKNMEERRLTLRAERKSKVQPSQKNRRKARPKKRPGDCYTVTAFARGVREAIRRHNAGRPEAEQLPHWHLHQLRHLRALELKRAVGLDLTRAVLGHRSPNITEMYATLDTAKAAEVMAKLG
jgi:integrase